MKFLSAFLGFLFVLAVFHIAVTRVVDPRGEFGAGIFPRLTLDARGEKMRDFKKFNATEKVQALILGSSRSMKLKPQDFQAKTGLRWFNFAVDNGRADDFLAIYRWTKTQNAQPKSLVIGLDVIGFHNAYASEELRDHPVLQRALDGDKNQQQTVFALWNDAQSKMHKQKDTFSIEYWRDILQSVSMKTQPPKTPDVIYDADGLVHWRDKEAQSLRPDFNLNRVIEDGLPSLLPRYAGMTALSIEQKKYLEALLGEAKADGAVVKIWLTPLPPRVSQVLSEKTRYGALLQETRSYLRELKSRYKIETYDFSEIALYGGQSNQFYDNAHLNENGAHVVASRLLN